jgi:hypothetical protein
MNKLEYIIYKILGCLLLSPSIVGVINFFTSESETIWTGVFEYTNNYHDPLSIESAPTSVAVAGYPSTLPIFYGLLAIAGVILLVKSKTFKSE